MKPGQILVLVLLAACAASDPPDARTPANAAPTGLTPDEREAREAIDTYRKHVALCAQARPPMACIGDDVNPSPDPCAPPARYQGPVSMTPYAAATHFYFDGQTCYQPTRDNEGACGFGKHCVAWSSLAACEAARKFCAGG